VFARLVGRAIKLPNAEDLFAAALLQDMAIPLLLRELPDQYQHLIERCGQERLRLSQLEREVFGWDHAEAAAALVRNWRLPEEFAVLIERHPNLDALLSSTPPLRDAAAVALASLLPSCRDQQWEEREEFLQGCAQLLPPSPELLASLMREVDAGFEEFAPILKLPVPERSLTVWISEAVPV
jgi:HD-like signal output (HDOD) protein